jgi:hypothetical protein
VVDDAPPFGEKAGDHDSVLGLVTKIPSFPKLRSQAVGRPNVSSPWQRAGHWSRVANAIGVAKNQATW